MTLESPAPANALRGLSEAEASKRLAADGPNVLGSGKRSTLLRQLAARFNNPLVVLLLAASAMSAATGDIVSATIIVVMVMLSVSMDFVQEHRAGRAADSLRKAASVRASIIRDGQTRDAPAEEVVAGDLVLLSAGDLVPADGTVLEARDLFVNQALLTGEAYPVEKRPGPIGESSEVATATGTVFMGSSVVSGSGKALITKTGSRTA
ncbi:MAG TPA: cation-transporting P-type ATPase, partial [Polyangiaceae bacterium]|nr:cation-transporting P-type ATPase [Polyangiaceae bacterium]